MLTSIIWLITGQCNSNCRFCYTSRFRHLNELSTRECLRVIREAGEMKVNHIGFSGGEPLLRRDIFDLIREVCEYDIDTTIVTNGFLISEEIAKKLRSFNVSIYLSVDGLKENHELSRGTGSWSFIKKAINRLNKAEVEFSTVTALNKFNYTEIKEITEFSLSSGAIRPCFIPVMPFGKAKWKDVLTKKEVLHALRTINLAAREFDCFISLWCMPFALRFINSPKIHVGCCRKANSMDIGVNGDVLLCDVLDIALTTVKNKSLSTAFSEQENHELSIKVSKPDLNEPCLSCPVRKRCLGGCYARSLSKFKDFNRKDPLCPI